MQTKNTSIIVPNQNLPIAAIRTNVEFAGDLPSPPQLFNQLREIFPARCITLPDLLTGCGPLELSSPPREVLFNSSGDSFVWLEENSLSPSPSFSLCLHSQGKELGKCLSLIQQAISVWPAREQEREILTVTVGVNFQIDFSETGISGRPITDYFTVASTPPVLSRRQGTTRLDGGFVSLRYLLYSRSETDIKLKFPRSHKSGSNGGVVNLTISDWLYSPGPDDVISELGFAFSRVCDIFQDVATDELKLLLTDGKIGKPDWWERHLEDRCTRA